MRNYSGCLQARCPGRPIFKLLGFTKERQERGVEFVFLKDQIDTSSAIGKAMFRMLAVLAEMERALKLYESKEYSVAEITELTGVSKATLYRRLRKQGN